MNFKSYQEEDVPNKDAAAAVVTVATKKSSLNVGNNGQESKSKLKLKLKRWQATPGIVAAIVVAIMLCVIVVSSSSSLHGIRGTGGGGDGDASIYFKFDPAVLASAQCPTTGSPHPNSGGSTQTPGVVYFGLDFSTSSWYNIRIPQNGFVFGIPIPTYHAEWDLVWQDCAFHCNIEPQCATFTVHVFKHDNKKYWGTCYYHKHWLDNHGTEFIKKSLNKRSIVSGVCHPEDRWDGYK